jgi:hypothetical protein
MINIVVQFLMISFMGVGGVGGKPLPLSPKHIEKAEFLAQKQQMLS